MNAMSLPMSSTLRAALLAATAVFATASVTAAESDKKPEQSQAEVEKKLEDARRRLDAAARDVAELSMSMSEYSLPAGRSFIHMTKQRAMLGINLGRGGEESAEGVAIASVSPGGAAEEAGLKAGDVLLEIEGKPLKRDGNMSPRDALMKQMGEVKPGDKVQLRYRRDNKVATASVEARAPMDRLFSMPMAVGGRMATPALPFPPLAMMRAVGVFGSTELVPLTPKLGHYFGTEKGLLVVRAPVDSRLKLEDGDVIVDIDGRTPANPAHAFRILGSYQAGEQLKLNVLRRKKRVSVEITVPDQPSAAHLSPFTFHGRDELRLLPPPGVGPDQRIMISPAPVPAPPGAPAITIKRSIEDEPA